MNAQKRTAGFAFDSTRELTVPNIVLTTLIRPFLI